MDPACPTSAPTRGEKTTTSRASALNFPPSGGGLVRTVPGLQRPARRCTASRARRRRRRRRRSGGRWGGGAERARGAGDLSTRTTDSLLHALTHDVVHRHWGSVFWRSWARVMPSSAAACPSLGGRTLTSFTTTRRPCTRTALARPRGRRVGWRAGPRRGRRYTPAGVVRGANAGHARRQACERLAAGWRAGGLAGWRAGGYGLSRPCSG